MHYIKKLKIRGFKKFKSLDVEFNPNVNILVGENGVGKTTILEAIKIVLNQQYKNADKSILEDLFNADDVKTFRNSRSAKDLPRILIEIEFVLDANKDTIRFYGEYHSDKYEAIQDPENTKINTNSSEERYGITFKCEYNEEDDEDVSSLINDGYIPYEYYSLSWTTFSGLTYQSTKRPLHSISINTSEKSTSPAFNYYNKTLFCSTYENAVRAKAKSNFRASLDEAFEKLDLNRINENASFGLDGKKIILENILSVYENSVSLENQGSGRENLIKTEIALDKNSKIDVLLIEEPENHLSFTNLNQMIDKIVKQREQSQIIIATHSNMIASRLNIRNVSWIANDRVIPLNDLHKDTAEFFVKLPTNSFLQLLLSEKAILVEGATEYLLLPKIYAQINSTSLEEDRITVISCNGISYKRYLDVAEHTNKKVLVLTDNDGKQERIEKELNTTNSQQRIYMSEDIQERTWEVCFYNKNKEALTKILGSESRKSTSSEDVILNRMLDHKVDTAYKMLCSNFQFQIPDYITDALQWIKK